MPGDIRWHGLSFLAMMARTFHQPANIRFPVAFCRDWRHLSPRQYISPDAIGDCMINGQRDFLARVKAAGKMVPRLPA